MIFKHGFGRGPASGQPPIENCLKSKRFACGCLKKSQKNSMRERRPGPKVTTLSAKTTIWEHASGFHGFRGSTGSTTKRPRQLRLRPPYPHAPGARMTVVKQTPSNKFAASSQIETPPMHNTGPFYARHGPTEGQRKCHAKALATV